MNEIISELKINGINPNGERIDIVVQVGKPYLIEGCEHLDKYACPILVTPLNSKIHLIHGSGSLQSLCLAITQVLYLLQNYKNQGGQLVHDDGTEFPIEVYSFDITPKNT